MWALRIKRRSSAFPDLTAESSFQSIVFCNSLIKSKAMYTLDNHTSELHAQLNNKNILRSRVISHIHRMEACFQEHNHTCLYCSAAYKLQF